MTIYIYIYVYVCVCVCVCWSKIRIKPKVYKTIFEWILTWSSAPRCEIDFPVYFTSLANRKIFDFQLNSFVTVSKSFKTKITLSKKKTQARHNFLFFPYFTTKVLVSQQPAISCYSDKDGYLKKIDFIYFTATSNCWTKTSVLDLMNNKDI